MIQWLNQNAGAAGAIVSMVSALATVVLMLTTIVYAWHTRQLSVENRLLRKAGTDPRVVGYATINPYVYGALDFVIRNVGNGAARNVSYEIVSGGDDLKAKGIRLPQTGVTYAFLAQDEKISASMGMGPDVLGPSGLKPFVIEINYEDIGGGKHRERFTIDVAPFEGLHRLGSPPDEITAESLKKIAALMDGWATHRLQVESMSVTERREDDEEVRKMYEERRKKRDQRA